MSQLSLAIINAKLWTGTNTDINFTAIGVIGSVITIVDTNENVLSLCNKSTEIIDAKGQLVLPGFTDCHCHFLDGGLRLLSVQLRNVKSKEEFRENLKKYVQTISPGEWIMGGDWDHHSWGGILPTKEWIDDITPNNPVWLNRMDGHMCLANSVTLKMANITRESPNIQGGEIIKLESGEPCGILKDNAQNFVTSLIPKHNVDKMFRALDAAMHYVASYGVTEVHTMVTVDCCNGLWPTNLGANAENEDMSAAYEELDIYREYFIKNKLITRIRPALPLASWKQLKRYIELHGLGNEWFKLGNLKAMIDGSLGTHTAAFIDDYSDTSGYKGHLIWDPEILEKYIYDASKENFQVSVHAIGDFANKTQLNIFENVMNKLGNDKLRFRIEHAQHIDNIDIQRFGKLGVIPSMQMSHLADDGRWAPKVIGDKRMLTSWPMKSLLNPGAKVVGGSDWFVTKPSPLQGIYSAVTRNTIDNKHPNGLVSSECVTVEEALHSYTTDAAYAGFEELYRGSLAPGKLADIIILDKDILTIPHNEILTTNVVLTIVGGKIIYKII